MTSPTPYLLRGLYEWICDNGMSPYLRVVVQGTEIQVPLQYVEDGVIVLNTSPSAVRGLEIGDDAVMFSARFSGTPFEVYVPMDCVQAIYARETGQGLVFFEGTGIENERNRPCADPDAGEYADHDAHLTESGIGEKPRGRPNLKLVD